MEVYIMAKQIPNAKKKIFTVAKKHLFEKGYVGLTLRQVATQSGMAVGTIYNYFPSKDILVASIMAEDWLASLKAMKKACTTASSAEQGVRTIYDAIEEYTKKYQPIWKEYKGMPSGFGQRHLMLRNQLSDLLAELLEDLGHKEDATLCPLLAETVLACAMHKDIPYSMLSDMIARLFP
jgi:AcrR family transcriptional regulator